jgi:cytochrome c oxidase cbb3-type subunit 3
MSSRFQRAERRGVALAALCAIGLFACQRSPQGAHGAAVDDRQSPNGTAVSTLFPGGGTAPAAAEEGLKLDGNPQAIAEGKRLFGWYNCAGCHFNGAGGIGPALMDQDWIYGGSMDQIYASIYQGRPNGMPSWGAKLSTTEIWQITAYVRSLSRENEQVAIPTAPPAPTPSDAAREPEVEHAVPPDATPAAATTAPTPDAHPA